MIYLETIQSMMDNYPNLFVNEEDCLHHLFFVNGNGYEWTRGELVAWESPEARADYFDRRRDHIKAMIEIYGHREHERAEWEEKLTELDSPDYARLTRAREAKERAARNPEGKLVIYPICQFTKIMNIPDDIQPDWLDAAQRAIFWACGPLCRATDSDLEYLIDAQGRIFNIQDNRKIL